MAKGKRKQGERNWVSYLIDLEKNRDLKSAFLKGKKKEATLNHSFHTAGTHLGYTKVWGPVLLNRGHSSKKSSFRDPFLTTDSTEAKSILDLSTELQKRSSKVCFRPLGGSCCGERRLGGVLSLD